MYSQQVSVYFRAKVHDDDITIRQPQGCRVKCRSRDSHIEKRAPQSESDSSPAPVLFSMQVKTRILIRMLSFFSSLSVYGFFSSRYHSLPAPKSILTVFPIPHDPTSNNFPCLRSGAFTVLPLTYTTGCLPQLSTAYII